MMNALYVTVSIPLLLVLAGFNHAHGLTTFGKASNNPPQQPHIQPKSCTIQANCSLIKGTTCLKGFCYCGDNSHPVNGGCKAQAKGPHHICNTDDDCVEGADCIPKEKNKTGNSIDKVCMCQDGYVESQGGTCGGSSSLSILPGLIMIISVLARQLN